MNREDYVQKVPMDYRTRTSEIHHALAQAISYRDFGDSARAASEAACLVRLLETRQILLLINLSRESKQRLSLIGAMVVNIFIAAMAWSIWHHGWCWPGFCT